MLYANGDTYDYANRYDMIPSGEGQSGGYDLTGWNEWWDQNRQDVFDYFMDYLGIDFQETYPNFDIRDPSTYAGLSERGFDPEDSSTWESALLGWE